MSSPIIPVGVAAHGRSVRPGSGGVAIQLRVDLEPLKSQELLQLKTYGGDLRGQVACDQDLGALVMQALVELQVGFPGVGVDRHLGVAASADGGEVVEGDRPSAVLDVVPGLFRHQDLQRNVLNAAERWGRSFACLSYC